MGSVSLDMVRAPMTDWPAGYGWLEDRMIDVADHQVQVSVTEQSVQDLWRGQSWT